MVHFKKVNKFADRGKVAETAVQNFLAEWHQHPNHEFNRLVDAKAAGRTIKAAAADFEFFCPGHFGLIEVKETEHEYRLSRDKVPQLPRLRKRTNCGGSCVVVVFHSTTRKWRICSIPWLMSTGDKGSWNLAALPHYETCGEALAGMLPEVFGAN